MRRNLLSRLKQLIGLISLVAVIMACSKSTSTTATDNAIMYYDYYSYAPHPFNPGIDSIQSNRVCFDMSKQRIVWEKKNEWPVTSTFPNINYSQFGPKYDNGFSIPNYIIKIFPSSRYTTIAQPIQGIYFEKIDKSTGDATVSKQLLGPGDFNVNHSYYMSNVVSDGINYFFACNNGSIYCFDNNGNMVWKKMNYPLSNTWTSSYGGYGFIYIDESSLYISSFDFTGTLPPNVAILYCMNTTNGEVRWMNYGTTFTQGKNFAFGKNHLAIFDYTGQSTILRKSDGVDIASNAGTGTGSLRILPIGKTDDKHIIYSNRSGDIGYIDIDHPQDTRFVDINPFIDDNFIYTNGKIYSVLFSHPSSTITLSGIDPVTGTDWNRPVPIAGGQTSGLNGGLHYSYHVNNNKLFILSNFKFENNSISAGIPVGQNKISLSVGVVDINSGLVIRQYPGLPGGLPNFHRVFNVIVE